MILTRSTVSLLCLLVIDLVATPVIALAGVFLAAAFLAPIRPPGEFILSWAAKAIAFKAGPGILFYAAFFTSAWLWLYALAAGVVKIAVSLGVTIKTMRNFLDIDKKPITSLGWVAMLLTSIVYWSIALVRWYAST